MWHYTHRLLFLLWLLKEDNKPRTCPCYCQHLRSHWGYESEDPPHQTATPGDVICQFPQKHIRGKMREYSLLSDLLASILPGTSLWLCHQTLLRHHQLPLRQVWPSRLVMEVAAPADSSSPLVSRSEQRWACSNGPCGSVKVLMKVLTLKRILATKATETWRSSSSSTDWSSEHLQILYIVNVLTLWKSVSLWSVAHTFCPGSLFSRWSALEAGCWPWVIEGLWAHLWWWRSYLNCSVK